MPRKSPKKSPRKKSPKSSGRRYRAAAAANVFNARPPPREIRDAADPITGISTADLAIDLGQRIDRVVQDLEDCKAQRTTLTNDVQGMTARLQALENEYEHLHAMLTAMKNAIP